MAELHLIGTIASARDFRQSRLFSKWSFSTGNGWKIINGCSEGQTQECCDPYSNEPVWDHPVDLHFTTKTLQGSPKALLQVFCRDDFNKILFVSYGVCSIPLKPGFHSIECHTWKPIGDWQDRLKDKFLGTTLQLKSPDVLVNADDRFELLTESMGIVRIDLHVLAKNFDKFGFTIQAGFCDINCCCDSDCTEHDSKVFSRCIDREIDKEKDSWYCHEKPFFRHNETRFIFKKIVDSLFCIASDNLPPMYSASSDLQIEDKSSFKNIISNNKPSSFKWKLDKKNISFQNFNVSSQYHYGDILWTINKNSLQPFDLPQSGFGKMCDFKKAVRFLEDWTSSCYQSNLTNNNIYLFPSNFINFTIIATPSKFNSQYIVQDCPKAVCQSINVFICSGSLIVCNANETVKTTCSENICYNAVKKIVYVIQHNGSEGIKSIDVHFRLANVSNSFKQEFEVRYKWINANESLIIERSGNPGYIAGKPIFVGTQLLNKTNDMEIKYIAFNKIYKYLTLPMAYKSGICSETERYPVKFLENIKLKCSIVVETSNFSTSTCVKLQNRTIEALTSFMTFKNFEQTNFDRQFVSKSGNISDNNTKSWTKIFFEKSPQNIISARITESEIQCSGLVTSVIFDIVHSLISKPGSDKNHVILGVQVAFSQGVDLKWPKCIGKNCTDILQLDVVSFVSFHDVSKPTRYHIAGGPNLDISLPYDFFYPFLSHSRSNGTTLKFKLIHIYITLCFIFKALLRIT
ncbi:PREDICTED: tectonic-3-like [Ceratosolen solmsi marchali]|uniref:Tectonic-3-like n=1 Tax=Ceratosolen solmsi marchali TaxID=326594 RepID=A0AAJ6YFL7_9HYME|nr:PREDICTED: tectonic-3-like [Ceratosolen solmsi marchali]